MRKIFILGLAIALGGCASDMKNLNDSLRQVNATLAGRQQQAASSPLLQQSASSSLLQQQIGAPGGYQPTITVTVPAGLCDRAAFDDGVRVGYITTWNQQVSNRSSLQQLQLRSAPKDSRNMANAQLYKNKMISTAGLPQDSQYQMQVTVNADNCRYRGFSSGKVAGMNAADNEFKALMRLEA